MISFSMTFEDHIARSYESSFCTELAGDVASYAGLHIVLTISRCNTIHVGLFYFSYAGILFGYCLKYNSNYTGLIRPL